MRLFGLIMTVLLLPQLCFSSDVVCVHLNGGADEVYVGQWNTLEIWIENDLSVGVMDLSFNIHWNPSVTIEWDVGYGDYPPIQRHGRALDAFDLLFYSNHDFDNTSEDHISFHGATMFQSLIPGMSELCFSLRFLASGSAGISDGFCVQPYDYNSPPIMDWEFTDVSSHCPDFCGYPVVDMHAPYAPPECFDVVSPVNGDCDGNGIGGNIADLLYLTAYFFQNGPPVPNPSACDCDNYPGLNYGDLWQLNDYFYYPSTVLYRHGDDYVKTVPPVVFMVVGNPDGETVFESKILSKYFWSMNGETIECMMLILSFAAHPGEADLNCTGVDFVGSAATNLTANYDNSSKILWIWNTSTPAMSQWDNWDLVATAHFERDLNGNSGSGVQLEPGMSDPWRPILLLNTSYYDGLGAGNRVSYPLFVPVQQAYVGDADCSGGVDIDDVVYLINYIFSGGPPPGDPDNDGTPDC